jgi:hypothetical protein
MCTRVRVYIDNGTPALQTVHTTTVNVSFHSLPRTAEQQ